MRQLVLVASLASTQAIRVAHPLQMSASSRRFVLGLNQYSHDAGAVLLSTDGEVSIAVAKERVSRRKHDAGDVASSVQHALESVGASLEDVVAVAANNHHHRVLPFEARLPWTVPLGLHPATALSPYNLLPGVPKHEVSHHLAHAWSVIAQAPFESGLIMVADGMGEARASMERGQEEGDATYAHDLQLPADPDFVELPLRREPGVGYREAETAYRFSRGGAGPELSRVFKRWVPQRSPPELCAEMTVDVASRRG